MAMLQLFYGIGGWVAKATIKSGDSPSKKRPNRFVPSQQYAKIIKQKVAEANRTWSDYEDLNFPKFDEALHNEVSDNRIDDITVNNGRRRTVSFSDDVVVYTIHTYEELADSAFEQSENTP